LKPRSLTSRWPRLAIASASQLRQAELTFEDAQGRHVQSVSPYAGYYQLRAGTPIEVRRLDGLVLSVTLPDGEVVDADDPVGMVAVWAVLVALMLLITTASTWQAVSWRRRGLGWRQQAMDSDPSRLSEGATLIGLVLLVVIALLRLR